MDSIKLKAELNAIKEDRKKIAQEAKDSISIKSDMFNSSIDNLTSFLRQQNAIKECDLIREHQKEALDIVEKIKNTKIKSAKDCKRVIKLRNEYNYQIRRIKNTIKNIDIPSEVINEFDESLGMLRKSFSNYLRVIKRQKNIKLIQLSINLKKLTPEAEKKINNTIKNEKRFNKKCFEPKPVITNENEVENEINITNTENEKINQDENNSLNENTMFGITDDCQFETNIMLKNYEDFDLITDILKDFLLEYNFIQECNNIIKSQNDISDIITEISNTTINSDEDYDRVTKLRNKLNYQVNKIKNTIKNINIPSKISNDFNLSLSLLRKAISNYLKTGKKQIDVECFQLALDLNKITPKNEDTQPSNSINDIFLDNPSQVLVDIPNEEEKDTLITSDETENTIDLELVSSQNEETSTPSNELDNTNSENEIDIIPETDNTTNLELVSSQNEEANTTSYELDNISSAYVIDTIPKIIDTIPKIKDLKIADLYLDANNSNINSKLELPAIVKETYSSDDDIFIIDDEVKHPDSDDDIFIIDDEENYLDTDDDIFIIDDDENYLDSDDDTFIIDDDENYLDTDDDTFIIDDDEKYLDSDDDTFIIDDDEEYLDSDDDTFTIDDDEKYLDSDDDTFIIDDDENYLDSDDDTFIIDDEEKYSDSDDDISIIDDKEKYPDSDNEVKYPDEKFPNDLKSFLLLFKENMASLFNPKKKKKNNTKKRATITYFLSATILINFLCGSHQEKNNTNTQESPSPLGVTFIETVDAASIDSSLSTLVTGSEKEMVDAALLDNSLSSLVTSSETDPRNLMHINNLFKTDTYKNNIQQNYSRINFDNMSHVVREREILTKEQLDTLLGYMCDEQSYFNLYFENEYNALSYLYNNPERTYEEKMFIIMARENLTYEQLDAICAGTIAEGYDCYEETYRVASVLFNRCHCTRWIACYGTSLYGQYTASGQFQVFGNGRYKRYLGCIEMDGYRGAINMLYSRIPSIDYLSFRGKDEIILGKFEQFLENGNKFFNSLINSERVESDYMEIIEQELEEDSRRFEKSDQQVLVYDRDSFFNIN